MFSDPVKVVPYFELREGERVADFGAGSGVYTLEMAKRVGHTGVVYAVEVQNNLLERLAGEARTAGLGNVKIVWGDVDKVGGSKLQDSSVDLVLVANVLFQSEQKYTLVLEAKRVLAPTGRIVLVERMLPAAEAKAIFAEAGFQPTGEFPAGSYHYGLIFKQKT